MAQAAAFQTQEININEQHLHRKSNIEAHHYLITIWGLSKTHLDKNPQFIQKFTF